MLEGYMRVLLFLLICLTASPALAQDQVPDESMQALQNILGNTRDTLWEKNDEFWHRGEFERCIATMRLITQIDPHDMEAYDDGAWLMQNQLRDDEAEVFLKEGLANNPDSYFMYFCLGYFYYIHERFDEAIDCLSVATTFDPPMTSWHTLAHAYENAGYVDSALNTWVLRSIVDPENPVPPMQITRMMSGGEPSGIPQMMSRAREERKARAKMK
jgi:tetratricopeptide (TPR) repeat protein